MPAIHSWSRSAPVNAMDGLVLGAVTGAAAAGAAVVGVVAAAVTGAAVTTALPGT